MPKDVAVELRRRARAAGVRIILIRRGVRMSSDQRQCYFVRTDRRGPMYQSHLALDDVADLLDVDLTPLRDGGSVADAAERPDPVFLVCTHGRHDACCSIRGNQVSRVACAEPAADAWECSHIGGDRFAANLVCFPHGIYYGRVAPNDVLRLMHAHASGTVALEHYRGRCIYTFPIQAAEYFARRETNTTGVDDVTLVNVMTTHEGLTASFSLSDGSAVAAEVTVSDAGEHRLTCRATRPNPIPRYDLVSCAITGA